MGGVSARLRQHAAARRTGWRDRALAGERGARRQRAADRADHADRAAGADRRARRSLPPAGPPAGRRARSGRCRPSSSPVSPSGSESPPARPPGSPGRFRAFAGSPRGYPGASPGRAAPKLVASTGASIPRPARPAPPPPGPAGRHGHRDPAALAVDTERVARRDRVGRRLHASRCSSQAARRPTANGGGPAEAPETRRRCCRTCRPRWRPRAGRPPAAPSRGTAGASCGSTPIRHPDKEDRDDDP